jgi:glutamine amidotransferase
MSLAIIDSGGSNISSVIYALRRLGAEPVFTRDPAVIRGADRVILPGVGAAAAAMAQLREADLISCIRELRQPVLGICLGMQLLYEHSTEDSGDGKGVECLGVVPGKLEKLQPSQGLRVPHMGWNVAMPVRQHALFDDLPLEPWFYFVHSYRAPVTDDTLATSAHGETFTAVVGRGNFMGAQFHPERSAAHGARLLQNFLEFTEEGASQWN